VIRSWVVARCDPYKDKVPDIPLEMIEKTAQVYIDAFERITGQPFAPTPPAPPRWTASAPTCSPSSPLDLFALTVT
jgi:hypothetical protein